MNTPSKKFELHSVPCIRCGYCCMTCICPYGTWDETQKKCTFLEGDRPGFYYCGIYNEIIADSNSKWVPAFGTSCCSSLFNDQRMEAFKNLHSTNLCL